MHLDFGNIGIDEVHEVDKALCSGMVSTATPQVTEFEKKMAGYFGVSDTVATNSGTAALHLALLACGIGPGNEVILPALTFIATANAIIHAGAKPVFVDVDRDTWNIDPEQVEQVVTDKTKAILPVHLYGNPCDMGALYEIAKVHELFIIEDAAESIGATYGSSLTGTIGDIGCFSFNGNKTITTGGGGLLVSYDFKKTWIARCLSRQGQDSSGKQVMVGYNYKMTGLAASLGLAQFERLQGFLKKKREFMFRYYNSLYGSIVFQETTRDSTSSFWYTACVFREDAEKVQNKLSALAIPTRRVFEPIPYMIPYKEGKAYPNADYVYKHGLCLPCSTLNTIEDIDKVCEGVKGIL